MRFRRFFACCLPFAFLAACGRGEPTASPAAGPDGGTLVVAEPGDADNLLPPVSASMLGHVVADLVYDHLAEIGDSMQTTGDLGFKPQLADHWTWARDSMSVAFHLNPRARWHDGVPVRAADVRFSLALYKNPKLGSHDRAPALERRLRFGDGLAHRGRLVPRQDAGVVLQHRVPAVGAPASICSTRFRPNGSPRRRPRAIRSAVAGFRFAKWEPGSQLVLVADTGNYRGPGQARSRDLGHHARQQRRVRAGAQRAGRPAGERHARSAQGRGRPPERCGCSRGRACSTCSWA